jgi:hypothetical protein
VKPRLMITWGRTSETNCAVRGVPSSGIIASTHLVTTNLWVVCHLLHLDPYSGHSVPAPAAGEPEGRIAHSRSDGTTLVRASRRDPHPACASGNATASVVCDEFGGAQLSKCS